jgi:hypothetical protein
VPAADEEAAPVAVTSVAKATPAVSSFDEDDVPVPTSPVAKQATGGQNAQDILAMIRARQNKQ